MTYKETIADAMRSLSEQEERVSFIGYNVAFGRAGGTLAGVAESKLIEMPLAENLMAGAAIGLSLEGHIPVLYFERMDFLLCALDAVVNHLDKLEQLSEGKHRPAVIIRCVVGNKATPLFTGATHTQDFTTSVSHMLSFPVFALFRKENIAPAYDAALNNARCGVSTLLVEYKDLYAT